MVLYLTDIHIVHPHLKEGLNSLNICNRRKEEDHQSLEDNVIFKPHQPCECIIVECWCNDQWVRRRGWQNILLLLHQKERKADTSNIQCSELFWGRLLWELRKTRYSLYHGYQQGRTESFSWFEVNCFNVWFTYKVFSQAKILLLGFPERNFMNFYFDFNVRVIDHIFFFIIMFTVTSSWGEIWTAGGTWGRLPC